MHASCRAGRVTALEAGFPGRVLLCPSLVAVSYAMSFAPAPSGSSPLGALAVPGSVSGSAALYHPTPAGGLLPTMSGTFELLDGTLVFTFCRTEGGDPRRGIAGTFGARANDT